MIVVVVVLVSNDKDELRNRGYYLSYYLHCELDLKPNAPENAINAVVSCNFYVFSIMPLIVDVFVFIIIIKHTSLDK